MRTHSIQKNHRPAHSSEFVVQKVMLVYDDTDAGLRAKLALEHLPTELKLAQRCAIRFWRQDLLSLPWLREQAALEARDADVIVVSIDQEGEIPGEIKDWMIRWLKHKECGPCALVVLADSQSLEFQEENSTIKYAQRIAELANAIFFCLVEQPAEIDYLYQPPNQQSCETIGVRLHDNESGLGCEYKKRRFEPPTKGVTL